MNTKSGWMPKVLTIVATCVLPGAALAQVWDNTPPTLVGGVYDLNTGEPINGARVSVGTYVDSVYVEAFFDTTDADGQYRVGVDAGRYAVVVSADGYATITQDGVMITRTVIKSFDLVSDEWLEGCYPECIKYSTSGGRGGARDLQIELQIVDDSGRPVSGAIVHLEVSRNSGLVLSGGGETDKRGRVRVKLSRAADGVYVTTVKEIQKPGYRLLEEMVPENEFEKGVDASPAEFCW